ncbi:hypothetical protein VNO77_03926 [Canavalia gladiata]|uniref:Uncharacterized protein n=1 Tax=Canavalia gladiata TaxID=3824 RepID=A0AAN9MXN3_CANGL
MMGLFKDHRSYLRVYNLVSSPFLRWSFANNILIKGYGILDLLLRMAYCLSYGSKCRLDIRGVYRLELCLCIWTTSSSEASVNQFSGIYERHSHILRCTMNFEPRSEQEPKAQEGLLA